jgi:hypothetical protein
MSRLLLIAVVALLCSRSSFAQEWREFYSKDDLFGCNFPGEPVVTNIVWETEYGASTPARVYTVKQGAATYSVTAVDYTPVKDALMAKAKQCPPGLERCDGLTSFSGAGYWKNDLRGAMVYAAFRLMRRDIKLTHYMWNYLGFEGVEANELQFINNADQSRSFATIYMHHNMLYVMEANVPANYPAPGLFVQSIALYERDGRTRANHDRMFYNGTEVDPTETNQFKGPRYAPGVTP